MVIIQIISW